MRTFYAGHDHVYRRLKAAGKAGWDGTEADYSARQAGLDEILRQGHAPRQGRLLELGCGAGNMSVWLAERGFEVTGVDISETAIDWARARAGGAGVAARFALGSVLELDGLEDGSFDFVLDGHCLHCIIGPDRRTFLRTAFRLLKPDGYLLVDTMCGPVIPGRFEGYDPESRCTIIKGIATRYFGTPEEIGREVADSGFHILATAVERAEGHGNVIIQARKSVVHDCTAPRGALP